MSNNFKNRLDELVKLRNNSSEEGRFFQFQLATAVTLAEELHAEVDRLNGMLEAKLKLVASDDLSALIGTIESMKQTNAAILGKYNQLRTAADKMKEAGERLKKQLHSGVPSTDSYRRSIDDAVAVWDDAETTYEQARGGE